MKSVKQQSPEATNQASATPFRMVGGSTELNRNPNRAVDWNPKSQGLDAKEECNCGCRVKAMQFQLALEEQQQQTLPLKIALQKEELQSLRMKIKLAEVEERRAEIEERREDKKIKLAEIEERREDKKLMAQYANKRLDKRSDVTGDSDALATALGLKITNRKSNDEEEKCNLALRVKALELELKTQEKKERTLPLEIKLTEMQERREKAKTSNDDKKLLAGIFNKISDKRDKDFTLRNADFADFAHALGFPTRTSNETEENTSNLLPNIELAETEEQHEAAKIKMANDKEQMVEEYMNNLRGDRTRDTALRTRDALTFIRALGLPTETKTEENHPSPMQEDPNQTTAPANQSCLYPSSWSGFKVTKQASDTAAPMVDSSRALGRNPESKGSDTAKEECDCGYRLKALQLEMVDKYMNNLRDDRTKDEERADHSADRTKDLRTGDATTYIRALGLPTETKTEPNVGFPVQLDPNQTVAPANQTHLPDELLTCGSAGVPHEKVKFVKEQCLPLMIELAEIKERLEREQAKITTASDEMKMTEKKMMAKYMHKLSNDRSKDSIAVSKGLAALSESLSESRTDDSLTFIQALGLPTFPMASEKKMLERLANKIVDKRTDDYDALATALGLPLMKRNSKETEEEPGSPMPVDPSQAKAPESHNWGRGIMLGFSTCGHCTAHTQC